MTRCARQRGGSPRCATRWTVRGVVPFAGLSATQFQLTQDQQQQLFLNGVRAGTEFVIEMAAGGGVPRDDDEARAFLRAHREPGADEGSIPM
jgi:hypothetical protein